MFTSSSFFQKETNGNQSYDNEKLADLIFNFESKKLLNDTSSFLLEDLQNLLGNIDPYATACVAIRKRKKLTKDDKLKDLLDDVFKLLEKPLTILWRYHATLYESQVKKQIKEQLANLIILRKPELIQHCDWLKLLREQINALKVLAQQLKNIKVNPAISDLNTLIKKYSEAEEELHKYRNTLEYNKIVEESFNRNFNGKIKDFTDSINKIKDSLPEEAQISLQQAQRLLLTPFELIYQQYRNHQHQQRYDEVKERKAIVAQLSEKLQKSPLSIKDPLLHDIKEIIMPTIAQLISVLCQEQDRKLIQLLIDANMAYQDFIDVMINEDASARVEAIQPRYTIITPRGCFYLKPEYSDVMEKMRMNPHGSHNVIELRKTLLAKFGAHKAPYQMASKELTKILEIKTDVKTNICLLEHFYGNPQSNQNNAEDATFQPVIPLLLSRYVEGPHCGGINKFDGALGEMGPDNYAKEQSLGIGEVEFCNAAFYAMLVIPYDGRGHNYILKKSKGIKNAKCIDGDLIFAPLTAKQKRNNTDILELLYFPYFDAGMNNILIPDKVREHWLNLPIEETILQWMNSAQEQHKKRKEGLLGHKVLTLKFAEGVINKFYQYFVSLKAALARSDVKTPNDVLKAVHPLAYAYYQGWLELIWPTLPPHKKEYGRYFAINWLNDNRREDINPFTFQYIAANTKRKDIQEILTPEVLSALPNNSPYCEVEEKESVREAMEKLVENSFSFKTTPEKQAHLLALLRVYGKKMKRLVIKDCSILRDEWLGKYLNEFPHLTSVTLLSCSHITVEGLLKAWEWKPDLHIYLNSDRFTVAEYKKLTQSPAGKLSIIFEDQLILQLKPLGNDAHHYLHQLSEREITEFDYILYELGCVERSINYLLSSPEGKLSDEWCRLTFEHFLRAIEINYQEQKNSRTAINACVELYCKLTEKYRSFFLEAFEKTEILKKLPNFRFELERIPNVNGSRPWLIREEKEWENEFSEHCFLPKSEENQLPENLQIAVDFIVNGNGEIPHVERRYLLNHIVDQLFTSDGLLNKIGKEENCTNFVKAIRDKENNIIAYVKLCEYPGLQLISDEIAKHITGTTSHAKLYRIKHPKKEYAYPLLISKCDGPTLQEIIEKGLPLDNFDPVNFTLTVWLYYLLGETDAKPDNVVKNKLNQFINIDSSPFGVPISPGLFQIQIILQQKFALYCFDQMKQEPDPLAIKMFLMQNPELTIADIFMKLDRINAFLESMFEPKEKLFWKKNPAVKCHMHVKIPPKLVAQQFTAKYYLLHELLSTSKFEDHFQTLMMQPELIAEYLNVFGKATGFSQRFNLLPTNYTRKTLSLRPKNKTNDDSLVTHYITTVPLDPMLKNGLQDEAKLFNPYLALTTEVIPFQNSLAETIKIREAIYSGDLQPFIHLLNQYKKQKNDGLLLLIERIINKLDWEQLIPKENQLLIDYQIELVNLLQGVSWNRLVIRNFDNLTDGLLIKLLKNTVSLTALVVNGGNLTNNIFNSIAYSTKFLTELTLTKQTQLTEIILNPKQYSNLKILKVANCEITAINNGSPLEVLYLLNCEKLSISKVEGVSNTLKKLFLDGCEFENLEGKYYFLEYLEVSNCKNLSNIQAEMSLRELVIHHCPLIKEHIIWEVISRFKSFKNLECDIDLSVPFEKMKQYPFLLKIDWSQYSIDVLLTVVKCLDAVNPLLLNNSMFGESFLDKWKAYIDWLKKAKDTISDMSYKYNFLDNENIQLLNNLMPPGYLYNLFQKQIDQYLLRNSTLAESVSKMWESMLPIIPLAQQCQFISMFLMDKNSILRRTAVRMINLMDKFELSDSDVQALTVILIEDSAARKEVAKVIAKLDENNVEKILEKILVLLHHPDLPIQATGAEVMLALSKIVGNHVKMAEFRQMYFNRSVRDIALLAIWYAGSNEDLESTLNIILEQIIRNAQAQDGAATDNHIDLASNDYAAKQLFEEMCKIAKSSHPKIKVLAISIINLMPFTISHDVVQVMKINDQPEKEKNGHIRQLWQDLNNIADPLQKYNVATVLMQLGPSAFDKEFIEITLNNMANWLSHPEFVKQGQSDFHVKAYQTCCALLASFDENYANILSMQLCNSIHHDDPQIRFIILNVLQMLGSNGNIDHTAETLCNFLSKTKTNHFSSFSSRLKETMDDKERTRLHLDLVTFENDQERILAIKILGQIIENVNNKSLIIDQIKHYMMAHNSEAVREMLANDSLNILNLENLIDVEPAAIRNACVQLLVKLLPYCDHKNIAKIIEECLDKETKNVSIELPALIERLEPGSLTEISKTRIFNKLTQSATNANERLISIKLMMANFKNDNRPGNRDTALSYVLDIIKEISSSNFENFVSIKKELKIELIKLMSFLLKPEDYIRDSFKKIETQLTNKRAFRASVSGIFAYDNKTDGKETANSNTDKERQTRPRRVSNFK